MTPERRLEIRKEFFRQAQVKAAVKIAMLEELEGRTETCGPFGLIEAVQNALDELGGESSRLIVDRGSNFYARASFTLDDDRYEVEVHWSDLQ